MQLRCTYCQTMFAISREEMLAGLEHMEENKLAYYDAHCPKCRRANRVERARMERFFPDWKKAIKTMAQEADKMDGNAGGSKVTSQEVKTAGAAKITPKTQKKPSQKPKKKAAPKAIKKPLATKKK
jgi:hypothetical protein